MAASAAALLDELMGRGRNLAPTDQKSEVHWDDPEICKYFLCGFCPHELFVNTRADLGQCPKVHDDILRKEYEQSSRFQKCGYEEDFMRFLQSLIADVEKRIRRGHQRLALNATQGTLNGNFPSAKEDKAEMLTEKISELVNQAEQLGCEGKVEEAQGVMKLCDQLREERRQLETQPMPELPPLKQMSVCEVCGAFLIVGDMPQRQDEHILGKQHAGYATVRATLDKYKNPSGPQWADPEKTLEVCSVCSAFLVVGDAQQRIDEHLYGRQHTGYARIRAYVDDKQKKHREEAEEREAKELKIAKERENREKEREKEREERRKKEKEKEEKEREERRKEREKKKKDRSRSRSKGRQSRSRDRRSRSRDRRDRSKERRRHSRSRSKHRQRSRSQERYRSSRSARSRSRSRSRRRSKSRGHDRESKRRTRSRDREIKRSSRSKDRESRRRSRSRDHSSRDKAKRCEDRTDKRSRSREKRSQSRDKRSRSQDKQSESSDKQSHSQEKQYQSSETENMKIDEQVNCAGNTEHHEKDNGTEQMDAGLC